MSIDSHGVIHGENRNLIVDELAQTNSGDLDEDGRIGQGFSTKNGGVSLEVLVTKLREELAAEQDRG